MRKEYLRQEYIDAPIDIIESKHLISQHLGIVGDLYRQYVRFGTYIRTINTTVGALAQQLATYQVRSNIFLN